MDPDPAFPKKFDSLNNGVKNEQLFSREKKKWEAKKWTLTPNSSYMTKKGVPSETVETSEVLY